MENIKNKAGKIFPFSGSTIAKVDSKKRKEKMAKKIKKV